MLDPRIEIENMIWELREKIADLEAKLWSIPHHEEPVEEYEAVFTAPSTGDYLHPDTPTHEKPEGFSDEAYWDSCMQVWMEPTTWEWDTYNYCDNANADVSYECESNTWVESSDWSNDYASEWYDYDTANTVFVEEEHHDETGNADMTDMEPVTTEPVLDNDGFVVEDEAPMETAPEMPAEMPVDAPMPTDMPATMESMPETAPMPDTPASDEAHDETNPPTEG